MSARNHSDCDSNSNSNSNSNSDSNSDNKKTDPNSYQDDDRTLYRLPPRPSCTTYNTDTIGYDLDALVETLTTDGVVVLPDVYSGDQIEAFREAHRKNFSVVEDLVSQETAIHKPYRHDFDRKRYYLMPHYRIEDEETGESDDVIEISPGRFDYTFGMNGGDDSDDDDCDEDEEDSDEDDDQDAGFSFASIEFQRPKILADLMDRMLVSDYRSYAGALPSTGKSGDGPWHRDVYLLFDDETVDINLPHPYYFTVLIPLVSVGAENGATEFLLGSHKQTCKEALQQKASSSSSNSNSNSNSFQACVEPGSIIVFDGRVCHRGRSNSTDTNRTVLYMVWTKLWYNDY